MATFHMAAPWRDTRTGIWKLRRRIPTRYRGVAGKGDTIKISTGTADRKEAGRQWPRVLAEWAALEAKWERQLSMVVLTPQKANEITAAWAAWIAAGHPLNTGGERPGYASDLFEPLDFPEERTAERIARLWDRVEVHANEALLLTGISITQDTHPELLRAMLPAVQAAYTQADLKAIGVTGSAEAVRPLRGLQATLPAVPEPPAPASPHLSLQALFEAWKVYAVVKPRTVAETAYVVGMLEKSLGHSDAAVIVREDFRRWRDTSKSVDGITNNTWNNRLSMIRQVFAFAVDDGRLASNPADLALRLAKSKAAERHPYTDEEAKTILLAARREPSPMRRWAHWIMAFSGMRIGEVLQLTRGDIRQEGAIWFMAINEDEPGKTVKTSARRNVPIHPALIAEGFLAYAQSVSENDPIFPDKSLDKFGNRGGRGWNAVGKWVRDVVGIIDPLKAPDHSWRHRIEDELRAGEVPEDVRDAIVGHARKTTGRSYGIRGEALSRLYAGVCRIPSPLPVAVKSGAAPSV